MRAKRGRERGSEEEGNGWREQSVVFCFMFLVVTCAVSGAGLD